MEQITAIRLPNTKTDSTLVDYQICQTCGFRLMRVEAAIIHDQTLISAHCPICGLILNENGIFPGKRLSEQELEAAFERWLTQHSLTQDMLNRHYCLEKDSFFAGPYQKK
jgi:hypothetical protein